MNESVASAIRRLAAAITPIAAPGTDATGGTVDSLTEAVMGVTAGLVRIASAIEDLAEAIRTPEADKAFKASYGNLNWIGRELVRAIKAGEVKDDAESKSAYCRMLIEKHGG